MVSNPISPVSETESFWKKRLSALQSVNLSLNHCEPLDTKSGVGKRGVVIPEEIINFSDALPQTDILIAAFSGYLSRLSNRYSFHMAYADNVTKKSNAGSGKTLLEYLPLHIDLDPNKTFKEVCATTHEELKNMHKYKNYILDVLTRNSDLRTVLEDFGEAASISVVLVESLEDFASSYTKQITLVVPKKNEAECLFFYDSSISSEDSINRFVHHFSVFLRGICANPSLRISKLPLLNEKDQEQLLYEFNDTKREFPRDTLLQELFEEQAEKSPNNDAVIFKDKKITSRELNERSNQLARKLRERGVKPDQIVGLMVEDNSIEMIIGIVGILKAGGAFLSIDPDLPSDRIQFMIENSNVVILLTQGRFRDNLEFGGTVINLDEGSLFTGEHSNLERINHSKDLAYVFYTSGSTGKPKGVQIEHSGIVNQIYGLNKKYNFDSSSHHILLASITFDPSVQQIFLPLTSGGKLFLVSKSTKHSMKELWDVIASNQIDIVNTVPSLMNILLDHVNGNSNLHFRYIILAGEVFSRNLLIRLKETLSVDKIINIYGPTEATINTTLYECKPEEIRSTIPIGKPLMNYNVMILDENRSLVPIGVPGEICISGVGLARGYLNNPKLTAEKFVTNPFAPNERMYQTGDVGRWTTDGDIEFLGRIDHQVKIHGIRVELGEIEAALSQHPAVRETVVIDQDDPASNKRLVAYIVPNREHKPTIDELRRFLRDKLPDYMVPSAFVTMDAFPLTPHGKVDRRALPVSEPIKQEPENTFIPPRNELESQLIIIWERVLGIKPIGVKDDFFKLGGTSLLAMVLFAEIEKIFGKQLPLAIIFDAPTTEELARMLAKEEWSELWSPLVAIQPEGPLPPFFCVHGHRGNVIGFNDLVSDLGMDQPFYGIQARGLDGTPVGDRRIQDMAADYVKEIRTIQPQGPYFLGGWCMGGVLALEMAQQLQAKGEKVALLAMIESNHPKTPEFLPSSIYIVRLIYRLIERVDYEVGILRRIGTKEKLSHLSRKISTVMTGMQVKIEKMIESFFVKFHSSISHSRSYKLNALHEAHEEALLSYEPRPYQGRVAIFRASKQPLGIYFDPSLGWSKLIKGEVELHQVPGHFLNVFIEPSVHILGKKLKTCINEARQKI